MTRLTTLRAVRLKCLDCVCGSPKRVTLCQTEDCSLWPFRLGKDPSRAGRGNIANLKPGKAQGGTPGPLAGDPQKSSHAGGGETPTNEDTPGSQTDARVLAGGEAAASDGPPDGGRADLIRSELEVFRVRCAYCLTKLTIRQPKGELIQPEYFCDAACRLDHEILKDPTHPRFREALIRKRRMGGIRPRRLRSYPGPRVWCRASKPVWIKHDEKKG